MKPQQPYPGLAEQGTGGDRIAVAGLLTCLAIATLNLFALIHVGVIDRHLSLILFVATVPLAAWVALGVEAAGRRLPFPRLMNSRSPSLMSISTASGSPVPTIPRCRHAARCARP